MATAAVRKVDLDAASYEVRFGGRGQLVAHVMAGPGAAPLEQALTDNGFWLVPVQSRAPSGERAPVAA
jgi:hypothetical protein